MNEVSASINNDNTVDGKTAGNNWQIYPALYSEASLAYNYGISESHLAGREVYIRYKTPDLGYTVVAANSWCTSVDSTFYNVSKIEDCLQQANIKDKNRTGYPHFHY
jgi:hypothetical protein